MPGCAGLITPGCVATRDRHSYDGRTTPRTAVDQAKVREVHGGATVEGSMTQGASQGPMVWTMGGQTPESAPLPGMPSGMSAGSPVPPAGPPLHLPAGPPAAPPAVPPAA